MITIIGGGPSGLRTAELLAIAGKKVAVLEEDKIIGEPLQCTGIVTSDILKIIKIPKKIILNKIKKATIHSKNQKIDIAVDDLVIDRPAFDRYLAKRAIKAGADVITGTKIFKMPKGTVIGADGPASLVKKTLNPKIRTDFLIGKQATVQGKFENKYEVFFGSTAPGFFGWIVPESKTIARIGVASKNTVDKVFQKFVKGKILEIQAGLIPMFNPKIKLQKKDKYLVGDAAGQIKSSTGGGLIPGLKAAEILADCIIKNRSYNLRSKKLFPELYAHYRLREKLDKFTDDDYDDLLKNLKSVSFKNSSRDSIIRLLMRILLKKPILIKYALF